MATVPKEPLRPTISEITDTSMRLRSTDPNNGGSPITTRQIFGQRFGSTGSPTIHTFDLDFTWTALVPGTPYQFWWRAANALGFGPFSQRTAVTYTYSVPDAPSPPTLSSIDQLTFRASFPDPPDGGTGIFNRFIGISTSPTALPTTQLGYHGALFDQYGTTGFGGPLLPGRTYYVRAQVRNAIGDSAWSAPTTLHLIAGAWVKRSGVWMPAVPYVRVSGVWKLVRPQGRILGIWEETG